MHQRDLRARRRRGPGRVGLIRLSLSIAALALTGSCGKAPETKPTRAVDVATPDASAATDTATLAARPLHPHITALQNARRAAGAAVARGELDDALRVLDDALQQQQQQPAAVTLAAVPLDASTDDAVGAARAVARCDRGAVLSQRAARSQSDPRARERDLRAAVVDCPAQPVLVEALANALLLRARDLGDGSDTRAPRRALLEESLTLHPTVAAAVDLARLCDDADDAACAAAYASQAVALAPDDARLLAWRDRLQRHGDVEGTFKSARHAHFVARFEGTGSERLAWSALDVLEQSWFAVGNALDLRPVDPITVVIYTGAQYQQATATPDWSAGVFDGKIRIREGQLAADRGSLEDTLVHEYVHAALRNCVPGEVPTWFHEGLAQHFEKHASSGPARLGAAAKATLSTLDAPFVTLNEADARAAYATALWMVETLVARRGVYGLQQLLAEMKQHKSFDEALQRSFSTTTTSLWASLE